LDHLPENHPCRRIHGHNYVIVVELRGANLNEDGFIKDYRELKPVKEYLDETLDHRHLNNVIPIRPTAEGIAKFLFLLFSKTIPELFAIEVSETPKTNARYELG
jgi:6-pyruvoyltetrahydropterin/6-carboxytetrahydropterin synthase